MIPVLLRWMRPLGVAGWLASAALLAQALPLSLPNSVGGPVRWGSAALAQEVDVSSEEIMGYARSVLEMEGPRTNAYNEIRALLTDTNIDINSINLRCTTTNSLNQLPRGLRNNVRTIVVNYCNQASRIVQSNGLRNERFDAITAAYPQDDTLAEQIRAALMQLQQQNPSVPEN
ncbi:MAG: DUF4168 domain-containing protein [Leptolyngbya sp.]|nr:DUF4168 domain-containing protein [Leptolyngbya sp.]